MADGTYQPKVYRKQGGDELVVASGGTVTFEEGASMTLPLSTVATSATTIPSFGVSFITGTTLGPTYLVANPVVGRLCHLVLNPSSSGATHRAIITGGTTDITFQLLDAHNKVTLATSGLRSISMVGLTTSRYQILSTHTSTMVLGLGTS